MHPANILSTKKLTLPSFNLGASCCFIALLDQESAKNKKINHLCCSSVPCITGS